MGDITLVDQLLDLLLGASHCDANLVGPLMRAGVIAQHDDGSVDLTVEGWAAVERILIARAHGSDLIPLVSRSRALLVDPILTERAEGQRHRP